MNTQDVKVAKSRTTIVLIHNGKVLNVQKSDKPEEFDKLSSLIELGDMEGIKKSFTDISEGIKKFTEGTFEIDTVDKKVYMKGDTSRTPMPQALINKLRDHYSRGVDYRPLILFWKKCLMNPSVASRVELFDFMMKNNIPLTTNGDIIVEKGVKMIGGGKLVDCHSGTVDNSVGMTVHTDRVNVDPDRRNECSNGLHVGAPDYVRNHWSSDVVVTCTVSPEDVVSVPQDYGATKMRVCRYTVVGYADKCRINPDDLIYRLEDILDVQGAIESSTKGTISTKKGEHSSFEFTEESLLAMSPKDIRELIKLHFKDTTKSKRKSTLVNKAMELHAYHTSQPTTELLMRLSKQQLIAKWNNSGGEVLSSKTKKMRKEDLIQYMIDSNIVWNGK